MLALASVADELSGVFEADLVAACEAGAQGLPASVLAQEEFHHLSVRTLLEAHNRVEKRFAACDDLGTALGVVLARRDAAFDYIRAVQGVVQTAPARIRRVERVARIVNWDD